MIIKDSIKSKGNVFAFVVSIVVTSVAAAYFQSFLFSPSYKDASGCPPNSGKPVEIDGMLTSFDCFPKYEEVSRLPFFLVVFLLIPLLTFLITKGTCVVLGRLFNKNAK